MKRTVCLLLALTAAAFAADIKSVPQPTGAKIDTEQKAQAAVIQAGLRDEPYALRAAESVSSACFFSLGFDVAGFGKAGDRVWQMHCRHLEGRITKIAWVNAESGVVRFLFPEAER